MTETHWIFVFFFKEAVLTQEWGFQPEACVLRPKCAKKCQLSWVDRDKMLTYRSKSAITFLILTLAIWNLVFLERAFNSTQNPPFFARLQLFRSIRLNENANAFSLNLGCFSADSAFFAQPTLSLWDFWDPNAVACNFCPIFFKMSPVARFWVL